MARTFKDVKKGHTAYEAVSQLAAAKITTGYEDGRFKPANNLTRAHISAFLARAVKYQESLGSSSSKLNVHFLDVGQGDSIFVQAPNGKTMLIDAGTKEYGSTVVAYLKSKNVKKLDYVVATHPDTDHIGGLASVLESFSVGEFINSGKVHTTATYENLLQMVVDKKIPYKEPKAGYLISLDSNVKTQVLAVNAQASDTNDASIVLKLTYQNMSFLLMSDADAGIEEQIAKKYDVTATILKAGHHGSSSSSSLGFLQKVNPKAIILSYCTEMRVYYPSGVSSSHPAYATARDGDKDGWACEL